MLNDTLATALSNIMNAEKAGKSVCLVRPVSKIIRQLLTLMNEKGYIGSFEVFDDGRGKVMKVNLLGKINNVGVIKPRFPVKRDGFEKFEKRFLPAVDFGMIFVSTSQGIITHYEAKEKGIGGSLLAFVY